jgi:hypothetical protein
MMSDVGVSRRKLLAAASGAPLVVSLSASSPSSASADSQIGRPDGFPAIAVQSKIIDAMGVTPFAAGWDGSPKSDATRFIQAAADHLNSLTGGLLMFPNGTYKITKPIALPERVTCMGVGGYNGSLIRGEHRGNLFECSEVQFSGFERMAFTGYGCTAIRQTGSPTVNYLQNLLVKDCHFQGLLAECIYGNLFGSQILRNTFGVFGDVGEYHRHIVSIGTPLNSTNCNVVSGNRFSAAKGRTSGIWFDSGADLTFRNNILEKNTTVPIKLGGIINVEIEKNWFEMNQANHEVQIDRGSCVIESLATVIRKNHFVPHSSIKNIVQVNNDNCQVDWGLATGNLAGVQVINDSRKLLRS